MTARISLFANHKANPSQPDLRGEVHLTVALIQELAYYVNHNIRLAPGYGQNAEPGVVVRLSCWGQQPNPQKQNAPVLTGSLESPAETDRRAQEKAAKQSAPPQPAYGQAPPQPAYGQAPPPPYGGPQQLQQPVYPAPVPPPGPQPGHGQAPPPGPVWPQQPVI